MSRSLDRAGIFKAIPFSWDVRKAESGAVGISIGFLVTHQLDDANEWVDWSEYEDHHCYGDWWVVKKDGTVNQAPVDQLAQSLGWDGNLATVSHSDAPDRVVQITVKEDTYNNQTRYRAQWMNPEDYTPTSGGASEEDVKVLQSRFGSLLRAAAAGSATAAASSAAKAAAPKPPPPSDDAPVHSSAVSDDDIPF